MRYIINLPFLFIKKICFLLYLYSKTNFEGSQVKDVCNIIVWSPKFNWRYYTQDRILTDFAFINSLSNKNIKFKIVRDLDIGKYSNKTIYLSYDKHDKVFALRDYTKQLYLIITELEKQNNLVYPTSSEYLFWENKAFMHEKFKELNIPHPFTIICDSIEKVESLEMKFPFLVKEIHSCSATGVHKITNQSELFSLIKSFKNDTFLLQELLNIKRDLRVTFVGDKIVHFYWRINNDQVWKPTSTGHGSSVDFFNFPEQWREFIVQEFLKLKLVTGAFDIAWQDDDLKTTPLFLEVSPTYQVNPVITKLKNVEAYGKFKKKSVFGKESYMNQYISQTFDIINMVVDLRINKPSK
jgi:glutathione synthase/RimK-type ligase-like ATP-grasp enzyme